MNIQLIIDNIQIPIKRVTFSDGGSNVQLQIPPEFESQLCYRYCSIIMQPTTLCDNYVWDILLILNSLKHLNFNIVNKYLYLPYLPHGRADRVFEHGNALPLECFFEIVEDKFDIIFLTDPHSSFYQRYERPNLQIEVKEQHHCVIETIPNIESSCVLVSPDQGATFKTQKLQQALDKRMIASFVVEAKKKRDIATGKVISTTIDTSIDITNKICYIIDDICDGGGTFIPLAKLLKQMGAKKVILYVTHGIFSKGLDCFNDCIDQIYCYNIVANYVYLDQINQFNQR